MTSRKELECSTELGRLLAILIDENQKVALAADRACAELRDVETVPLPSAGPPLLALRRTLTALCQVTTERHQLLKKIQLDSGGDTLEGMPKDGVENP